MIIRGLGSLTFVFAQLRAAGFAAAEAAAAEHLRHALRRVGQGAHDFNPQFGANEASFSASIVAYHFTQISSHIHIELLDTLAGRGSPTDATSAQDQVPMPRLTQETGLILFLPQLLSWMAKSPSDAHPPRSDRSDY